MQVNKGNVGVWNGTNIQLFRVESVAAQGPTLSSPRGAVDAVGSNIVSRIGNLNLRGASANASAGTGTGNPGQRGGGEAGGQTDATGRPSVSRTGTGNGMGLGLRSAIV